jgi:N-acetylmuramoyl-L-alanine amidase
MPRPGFTVYRYQTSKHEGILPLTPSLPVLNKIWDNLGELDTARGDRHMQQGWTAKEDRAMDEQEPHLALHRGKRLIQGSAIALLMLAGGHLPVQGQAPTPTEPTSGAPSAQPGSSRSAIVRPILQVGSQGYEVTELQALLKLLGYYNGAVDGLYQDSTAIAVANFQRAAGLQADGIVGQNTWDRLLPPVLSIASPANPTTAADLSPTPTAAVAPVPMPTPTEAAPTPTATPTPTPTPAAEAATAPTPSVDLPVLRLGMRGSAVARLQERLRATGFYNGAIDGIFGAQTEIAVKAAQRDFRLDPDGVVGPATWAALLR